MQWERYESINEFEFHSNSTDLNVSFIDENFICKSASLGIILWMIIKWCKHKKIQRLSETVASVLFGR